MPGETPSDNQLLGQDLNVVGGAARSQAAETNTMTVPNAFSNHSYSTPSMRRGDLISVGRTHAHQNLVSNTEFTLGYESVILLYLSMCTRWLSLPETFTTNCAMNPKTHTLHFVMFVLWPVVCARLIIYLKLRNANFARMQNSMLFLTAFYNVAYGIWTVYNIAQIMNLPHD